MRAETKRNRLDILDILGLKGTFHSAGKTEGAWRKNLRRPTPRARKVETLGSHPAEECVQRRQAQPALPAPAEALADKPAPCIVPDSSAPLPKERRGRRWEDCEPGKVPSSTDRALVIEQVMR